MNAPVVTPPTIRTPEPASVALMATGLLALGAVRRRERSAQLSVS